MGAGSPPAPIFFARQWMMKSETASCKQVAAKVGPVAAYTGYRAMDEQRLTACNASAKGAQVAKQ